ncbi:hypothetical protein BCR33DRAFT_717386, partial [Rhizoclosmatium globosum]
MASNPHQHQHQQKDYVSTPITTASDDVDDHATDSDSGSNYADGGRRVKVKQQPPSASFDQDGNLTPPGPGDYDNHPSLGNFYADPRDQGFYANFEFQAASGMDQDNDDDDDEDDDAPKYYLPNTYESRTLSTSSDLSSSASTLTDGAQSPRRASSSSSSSASKQRRPRMQQRTNSTTSTSSEQTYGTNDSKRYECATCNRTFSRLFNLKSHLLTHDPSRTKSFLCDVCGVGFCRQQDLMRHGVSCCLFVFCVCVCSWNHFAELCFL